MSTTGIQINVDPRPSQQGASAVQQALNNIRDTVKQLASDINSLASTNTAAMGKVGDEADSTSQKMVRANHEAESAADSLKDSYEQLKGGLEALGAIEIAKKFLEQADAATEIQNKLRGAITGTTELSTATNDLYKVAQNTRASLGSTVDLFDHLSQATRDLGLNEKELVGLTQTVSMAIQAGGASAEQATASTEGFIRALTLGGVQGREFMAILSGSPKLAAELASAFGVHVSQLKQMAADGALNASSLISALQRAAPSIAEEFSKITPTVGGSLTKLQNYFDTLLESMDKITGASKSVKDAINTLSGGENAPRTADQRVEEYQRVTGNKPGGQSLIVGAFNEIAGLFKDNQRQTQEGLKDREDLLRLQRDPSQFPYFVPSQTSKDKGLYEFDMNEIDSRRQAVKPGPSIDEEIALRQLILNIADEARTQKDIGLAGQNQETLREAPAKPMGAQTKRVSEVDKADFGAESEASIKKIQQDVYTASQDTSVFLKDLDAHTQSSVNRLHNQFAGFFDFAEKSFQDLSDIQGTFLTDFTTGLADSLATGKFNFGQFAQYLLQQLLQIALRAIIVRSILALFGGGVSGAAGAGGAGVQAGSTGAVGAGAIQFAAEGTDYSKQGWMMTGEDGPELMKMNAGAQVMNSNDTQAMMRKQVHGPTMQAPANKQANMSVYVEAPNITIPTTGVTQNDVRQAVASGMTQAITQAVGSVQSKYRQGKL